MKELVTRFYQIIAALNRRRALAKIRREFARSGHPLDGVTDAQIEASLTGDKYEVTAVVLSAKIIYHALLRLAYERPMRPGVNVKEESKPLRSVPHRERALNR